MLRWMVKIGGIALLGVLAMALVLPVNGYADVPNQINYQGALTDDFGDPLDGIYIIVFSIYAVDTGGTALWWEQQTVAVTDSIYNVAIGQDPIGNPFPNDLFDDHRWLGVKVGSDPEMIPRQPLTSVPFALMADKVSAGVVTATMLADDAVTTDKIADSTITGNKIANETITAFNILDGSGSGLDADSLDGLDASQFLTSAAIADLENRIEILEDLLEDVSKPNSGTIRFSNVNLEIVSGSGYTNGAVNGRGNLIVGYNEGGSDRNGSHNIVVGMNHNYSSYGGLVAGTNNTISGPLATVTGGINNIASDYYSTVGGGSNNTASEVGSSICGGGSNTASGNRASICGGANNTASGLYSSVSGGRFNAAIGDFSYVGGGGGTDSNDGNIANGEYTSVTGGGGNTAFGRRASVSGGADNTATGIESSVSGGDQKTAIHARSTFSGSVYSNAGSVGIGTTDPSYGSTLDVRGEVWAGVLQITGGADLSEQFDIRKTTENQVPSAGMVVSIDPENPGGLSVSQKAYDKRVAGIISGAGDIKPGMRMGQKGTQADGNNPVALSGRVYCLTDASNGAIEPGDLLTTSNTTGHAMKVSNYEMAQGSIIGKAMTSLDEGKGLVLVLVDLQ